MLCISDIYISTYFTFSSLLFMVFFFFSLAHLWQVEVSGPGVEQELQLQAYTIATAMQELSCMWNLRRSLQQCRIFQHWAEPGIEPTSSGRKHWSLTLWATMGTPQLFFSLNSQLSFKIMKKIYNSFIFILTLAKNMLDKRRSFWIHINTYN